ncbi:hypothetical protein CLF_111545, partial [Clonorchis sinensis]
MEPGCDPTLFFASLQQLLDRALPELDGLSRQQLLSEQFVEGVHSALNAQMRMARATGQLSVEHLVHLARELAEAQLATFQSQENREDSTMKDLKNKVDKLAEQLAAVKTESRRQARTSRCYKCGMSDHWKKQCPRTRPLVNNKTLDYSSFPGWVAISAVTQATIQAVTGIDVKSERCLIETAAGVSLRRRGNQAECKPCALAVRVVGACQLKIDGLSMHPKVLRDKSVQQAFLTSPDIQQTILGADFLKSADSAVNLKHGKLVAKYGAVKLEGYPSTAVKELHVRKLPSCNVPSVQSVVEEYSELFTGDEDAVGFCPWIEHEIPLSSECFRSYGPRPLPLHLREGAVNMDRTGYVPTMVNEYFSCVLTAGCFYERKLLKDGDEVLSQHSSGLFACILEESVPHNWEESVIVPIFKKVLVEHADDIVLIFEEKVQVFLDKQTKVIPSFSMRLASASCNVMLLEMQSLNKPLAIQGETLDVVERFTYLGSCISSDCNVTDEVNARICKARVAFSNLRQVWRQSGISMDLRRHVYQATVWAVLLHSFENLLTR